MKNIVGHKDTDEIIRLELTRCGIEIVEASKLSGNEVNTKLSGKFGKFTFYRAWYYWIVKGQVPLAIAQELYKDPVGNTDIRVGGHCGCPSPDEYGRKYISSDGKQMILDPTGSEEKICADLFIRHPDVQDFNPANIIFINSKDEADSIVIDSYHIDSELGLYIFIQAIKNL